ncbi:MAG: TonB-dependent receptor [Vulcanimicrobiaceae bacterium]
MAFVLLSFFLPPVVRAQEPAGSIQGTVQDSSGAAVAGASVIVRGRAAGTHTDARGNFEIDGLPSGAYGIVISKAGYVDETVTDVAAGSSNVSVVLSPVTLSTLRQIGDVRSVNSTFNDSASATTNLSRQRLGEAGQIQIGHILDQTPGVISARPGSANASAPGSITSPNLRGALDYEKATLLDGHPLINGKNGDYPTMLVNSMLFDNIEVVEGPTAYAPEINYGIGGTLNFRTADPSMRPSGSLTYGVDNQSGSFANLRYSGRTTNGKLGYVLNLVTYGTQGPLNNYPSYFALPANTVINGYGKVSGSTTSPKPINGAHGPYPAPNSLGSPNNAYTTLAACCQPVSSDFLNHGELAKLQYHFSDATVATAAFVGIQSQYDGPAAGFTQVGSVFAPGAGYNDSGLALQSGLPFLLNSKTTLPDQRLYDNEPTFEGELRTTLRKDTVLARYYSAILARQTTSDLSNPSANYTTAPMTLYGTATVGGQPAVFDGTTASLTIPTPYSNSVEHDQLRGASFEYDHPVAENLYTFAVDRNTSLTNAYSVTGSASNPQGNLSTSIAAGTRQDFTTYLLRGTFMFGAKTQLTLANYYNVYRSTYTPATTSGNFIFQTVTTTHDDPRLGLAYHANPDLTLRISAGSAIAPPYPALIDNLNTTPQQIYSPGSTTVTVNKNSGSLLPETSFGYDVGGDWRLPTGAVLSVDGYLTNLRNQFVGVIYPNGTYTPPGSSTAIPVYVNTNANLAQSRFEGVEATLRRDPARGYGYTLSAALQRAYAYDIPPSFYTTAAGPYTTNLGVVDGLNFVGFNAPFFNGISNKSEAYGQGYAGFHVRGTAGQYAELGFTYYGANNTFDIPAFVITSASYRQPLGNRSLALQVSADNLLGTDDYRYVLYGTGIGAPLANGKLGIRNTVPYGPATFRVMLTRSF